MLDELMAKLRERDEIRAAWLTGSRGRGTSDVLSDIDLWIAVDDTAMPTVLADPVAYIQTMGPTMMEIVAPSIAPHGGAFVGTWVPRNDGFEQIDWYIAPVSTATRTSQSLVLFERTAIPLAEEPGPAAIDDPAEAIAGDLRLSLLMAANAWKHARRGDYWRVLSHLRHMNDLLAHADWIHRHGEPPSFASPVESFLPANIPWDERSALTAIGEMLAATETLSRETGHEHVVAMPLAAVRSRLTSVGPSGSDGYYARLARRRVGAGMLITDVEGRVLLVKPTYKPGWEIPGGVCEAGESPRETAQREVREELGLNLEPGALLNISFAQDQSPRGDSILLIYDGGTMSDDVGIDLQRDELAQYRFVPVHEIDVLVNARLAERIRGALRGRAEGRPTERG